MPLALAPCAPTIRLGKEPEGRVRWLETDEQARLLAACAKSKNPHLAAIVTVALETGMRSSETMGLTWEEGIDMTRGVIRLERTKGGRRREVPMRQAVCDLLAKMPEPRTGRLWPDESIRTAFENAVDAAKVGELTFHDGTRSRHGS
jgi:integrase